MPQPKTIRRLFKYSCVIAWIALNFLGIYFYAVPRNEVPLAVVILTFINWVFVITVQFMDEYWNLGGAFSVKKWLKRSEEERVKKLGDTEKTNAEKKKAKEKVEGIRHSQSLRVELITITTGFTAVLAIEGVKAYAELLKEAHPDTMHKYVLAIISFLLVLACIVNLLQMIIHILLAGPDWKEPQQESFLAILKKLERVGWNLFLTPVILFLCLMSETNFGYWLAFSANLLYGFLLWWYYFCLELPADFDRQLLK